MGLYDREYSREDDDWGYGQYGGRTRAVQSMTVTLIVINVAVYLADQLFSTQSNPHWLMELLALQPDALLKPWLWWQFVTAGFAHSTDGFQHIFWNMFGLYIFGRDVEGRLGRWEFLRFYLVALVLGNLFFALRALATPITGPLLGASGAVSAVVLLYICYFPRSTLLLFFVLPIPAWVAGVLFLLQDVIGAFAPVVPGQPRVAHDVHLAGAAVAVLYWKFNWNFGAIMPTEWLGGLQRWWNRPRLRIHDPEPTYDNLDAEADRVLEKVHSQGEASLTARERRVLEDYSRRMRQKLR
jgi:membrane associated rhomboid family serine protease